MWNGWFLRQYLGYPIDYYNKIKSNVIINNKYNVILINNMNDQYELTKYGKYFNDEFSQSRAIMMLCYDTYINILIETKKQLHKLNIIVRK